jgi:hypothetical protein
MGSDRTLAVSSLQSVTLSCRIDFDSVSIATANRGRRAMLFERIRMLCLGGPLATQLPAAALAGPTVALVSTGTSGGGTPGGSSIDAATGDTLTLTVVIQRDVQSGLGIPFAELSLVFDPDVPQAAAAVECPAAGSTPPDKKTFEGYCGGYCLNSDIGPALVVDHTTRLPRVGGWPH